MEEHIPATFHHMLMLPGTLLLLLVVPLALLLVYGSWLLVLMSSLTLFAFLWLLAKYTWKKHMAACLRTDLADITKTYLSGCASCFWVVERGGQVVGIVGALPVKKPLLQKKQLQLRHLCVALEHRGEGIAKALVRTVLQFARDQGYSEVVLSTSMLQCAALALYQQMGFQKTGQSFFTRISKLRDTPLIHFTYHLTSAQEGGL
jgi:ribosomal protein S18 acetylase RimI-like enzyme